MLVCSEQIINRLDSQSKFQMYRGCTLTWRLHTGLCKFVQNISRKIWGLGKVVFLTTCFSACCWLLKKLWTSSFVKTVDFLSVLSRWVGDWSSSELDSSPWWWNSLSECSLSSLILKRTKFCSNNCFCHFAVGVSSRVVYAFLVGPFFRPYHFDAYGPHTGPDLFSYGFPRKLSAGPYGSYDI